MTAVDLVGALGTCISATMFVPQALQFWRIRHDPRALAGLSTGTMVMLAANALVWFLYAWLSGAFWSGASGFLNLPFALWVLTAKCRNGRSEARSQRARSTSDVSHTRSKNKTP